MNLIIPLHGDAPLLSVRLALPRVCAEHAIGRGERLPDAITAHALISTGHEISFITRAMATRLRLPARGTWTDWGGDGLHGPVRRFENTRVRVLIVGDDGNEAFAEPYTLIVEGTIWNDVDILLGTNFLRNFTFDHDGTAGIAKLAWKFTAPPARDE